MTPLPLGLGPQQYPIPRMNDDGFIDDETVPVKTSDVTTRVGERDLIDLVMVEPDLLLSSF